MATTTFSIPSKTFLAGEYLALQGGDTLLAMTSPRFELVVKKGTGLRLGIPVGSPADKFVQRHSMAFAGLDLEFIDPHSGTGGWGASTAQYLGVYAAYESKGREDNLRDFDISKLLADYQVDSWDGIGLAPSGADLIGQYKGLFTFFERNRGTISRPAWPFENLEGFIVRTGYKVATHEHLRQLKNLEYVGFSSAMQTIREAWNSSNEENFCEGIKEYNRELQRQRLVAENTLSMLHDILWLDGVKAAKGCGAMGADMIFVIVDKAFSRPFLNWCEEKQHEVISLQERISFGLKIREQTPAPELTHG